MNDSRMPLEITPKDVLHLPTGSDGMLLLDCRTEQERALAHIADSMFLPMNELGDRLAELEPHRDRPIVVYCHTGRRSLMVARALRQAGFDHASSMAGGIDRWSLEIDPSIPRY
ncbi:MAG TPA: rhodanese-like domain-containing protein [Phycisphaerales bacterium]|nr:rhodanese-like domain-containing protein [Phycisphaerales bacterium]HRQ75282.1 rhodanese-like domain-containing protein [Phycisphaerales bacterium]